MSAGKFVRDLQGLGDSVLITAKCIVGLHKLGECILTTEKHVGACRRSESPHRKACMRLPVFGESVLTTAIRVGGLQSFGKSVLTTAKHAGGLQM